MPPATKPADIANLEIGSIQTKPVQHRSWWRGGVEILLISVIAIAGMELFFNTVGVGMEEILQPDPVFGTKHIPGKHVVWRMEGFSQDSFNSVGLRDTEHPIAKPSGVFRIALLGDSSTEGLQVPFEQTYGKRLEQLLQKQGKNVEVINFACSGYSTGQELLQFEQQVAAYKPDLTLLLYNRGDAVENVRPRGQAEPRPYFYINDAGKVEQDNSVLTAYAKDLQPNPLNDFLRKNSRIYGVLGQTGLKLSINEPLYLKLKGFVTPKSRKFKAAAVADAKTQDSLAVTSALLEQLDADCRKAGSKFVLVAFPNMVEDPEFARQIAKFQAMSKEDGFGFYDLTPSFHWNKDPMSHFFKYHFSGKGHKLVADRVGEYLLQTNQIPAKQMSANQIPTNQTPTNQTPANEVR